MQTPGSLRGLRLVAGLFLVACLLRLWHILVMRRFIDEPAIVTLWLAVTVVLVWLAFRPSRNGMLFVAACAVLVFLFHWGFERAASDGREYFAQVRSIVFDRDLDFSNEDAVLGSRGAAKMYPIGAAILWAPFMVLAHAWLGLLSLFGGTYSMEGYANPYQRAIGLGTLIYGCIGLLLMWRILRDHFGDGVASLTTLAITAGTFMLWYLTVENSMVHGLSMFATMFFLYVWHRGRPRGSTETQPIVPSTVWWIGLGLAAGLMSLVRWQNVLFAGLAGVVTLWQIRRAGWPAVRGALVFAAATVVAFLPQLIFWQIVRGSWMSVPAADHGFDLRSLHVGDVLFSPNHGLLSTTPLVYIALFGLPLFVRRDPPLALVLIGGFIVQVIVNSGSGDWWGGPSFGARRFDNCLLAFGVGLAMLLTWLRRRPVVAPMLVLVCFLAVNLSLMADVRRRALPSAAALTIPDMVGAVYARVGNPFSFPYNAYVGWRYDADWSLYDRLKGRTYSNIAIDFGDTGDDMFLGRGWSTAERGNPMTFRWASSRTATIVAPLRAPANYRLEIVGGAFEFPGSPRQTIDVSVNRTTVGRIVMNPGISRYELDIPVEVWRTNLNLIQFTFGYVMSPADARVSNDPRPLAVMFDSLQLRVRTGNTP